LKFKICIIGRGSIGSRHGNILKTNFACDVVYARRSPELVNEIPFKISILKKFNFDYFIICNPTSLHYETLRKLLNFKKPILVEKPLFFSTNKIDKFFIKKNSKYIFTAYMMRYEIGINFLLNYVKTKKPNLAYFKWLTYMPSWHTNEDYKRSYASSKKLGGGVISTCSHEIDMAIYLFNEVESVNSINLNKNLKKINVEEKNISMLKHKNGIVSKVYIDFSSKFLERKIILYYNDFQLIWDFLNLKIIKIENKKKKLILKYKQKVDDLYKKQMLDFINNSSTSNRTSYFNTIKTQILINKIYSSSKKK
tara:strand:- start:3397 stop:4323 length:927 start_codon:yes stop_codon:yes gene_type:complete